MDANTKRRLIALKSPQERLADTRPRCSDCAAFLTLGDFQSYWDGQDPTALGPHTTPRCCAEKEA